MKDNPTISQGQIDEARKIVRDHWIPNGFPTIITKSKKDLLMDETDWRESEIDAIVDALDKDGVLGETI